MAEDPWLFTCLGVAHDLAYLPHWLAHYRALGVPGERTVVLLNTKDPEDPSLEEAEAMIRAAGARSRRWIAPYTSETMWQARRDLQAELAGPDDWVLSADIDEFQAYPMPLPKMLETLDRGGWTCLQGGFVDRLAPGGALAPIAPTPSLAEQFPITTEVAMSLLGHDLGGTIAVMALKGRLSLRRGGHSVAPHPDLRHPYGLPLSRVPGLSFAQGRFALPTRVYHYRWTETLARKLRERLDTPGASADGQAYGNKQLDYMAQHGAIDLSAVPRPRVRPLPWSLGRKTFATLAKLRRNA